MTTPEQDEGDFPGKRRIGLAVSRSGPDSQSVNGPDSQSVKLTPRRRAIACEHDERINDLLGLLNAQQQLLEDTLRGQRTRNNASRVLGIDTTASIAPSIDMMREIGCAAESLTILSIPATAAIVISINGEEEFAAVAGDEFSNETIWNVKFRVTTTVAGRALFRIAGYRPGLNAIGVGVLKKRYQKEYE